MNKRSKLAGIGRAGAWLALAMIVSMAGAAEVAPAAPESAPPVAGRRPDVTTRRCCTNQA
ncbi:MAG: hypothetical protein VB143_08755 [Burkholderia sp.]